MRRAPDLTAAAIVVAVLVALRLGAVTSPAGEPGGSVGHALGIVGFVLILATQLAYSLRKRTTDRAWGPLHVWMRVHVFTGIVGPALVLLHAPTRLGGLAGWATIATMIVAVSGLVGRLLFAALPRAANEDPGAAPAALDGLRRGTAARRGLAIWYLLHVPLSVALFVLAFAHVGAAVSYSIGTR